MKYAANRVIIAETSPMPLPPHCDHPSDFTRLLCIAAHNLDLISRELRDTLRLELDVLDQKSPHIVTKAVGLEVALPKWSDEILQSLLSRTPTLNVSRDLT